ncbi:hypothetical protein CYMTET_32767, partial [Cymbomonas tetramitiformis]
DHIQERVGVGALARIVTKGKMEARAVLDSGSLEAIVAGLTSADPQTQCFAAGALRVMANSKLAALCLRDKAIRRLLDVAQHPSLGVPLSSTGARASAPAAAEPLKARSSGIEIGVQVNAQKEGGREKKRAGVYVRGKPPSKAFGSVWWIRVRLSWSRREILKCKRWQEKYYKHSKVHPYKEQGYLAINAFGTISAKSANSAGKGTSRLLGASS